MESIKKYSNPKIVYKNAKKYLGKDVNIYNYPTNLRRNMWFLILTRTNGSTLVRCFMKISPNIKMKKDEKII